MAEADPVPPLSSRSGSSELALRIGSALVLAPLAVAIAYLGGWPFVVFWGLAATAVLWEWNSLAAGDDRRSVFIAGAGPVVLSLALAGSDHFLAATIVMVMGALGVTVLAPAGRRAWCAGAIPYAGAIGAVPIVLRSDSEYGFFAMVFLFAIVWATDAVAYLVGRTVGGAKLMPRISPNKTWSGALGGTAAAVAVAIAVAKAEGLPGVFAVSVIAAVLSVASQLGDLFESYLKRKFGAKDSGYLIPGHGGLMDRLDGFVAAGLVAMVIGLWRGGLDAPGRGLLVW
jgi:phosphatidate cytidylyltransferase